MAVNSKSTAIGLLTRTKKLTGSKHHERLFPIIIIKIDTAIFVYCNGGERHETKTMIIIKILAMRINE